MALLNPHFDLPFRFSPTSAVCVEQDSFNDVANCVEVIVSTPQGFRDDSPDFGLPELEFANQPLHIDEISAIINAQEPRAEILTRERTDLLDPLIAHLTIEVS